MSRCNVWLYRSPERFVQTTWLPPSTPLYSGVSDFHCMLYCVCAATGTILLHNRSVLTIIVLKSGGTELELTIIVLKFCSLS